MNESEFKMMLLEETHRATKLVEDSLVNTQVIRAKMFLIVLGSAVECAQKQILTSDTDKGLKRAIEQTCEESFNCITVIGDKKQ